MGLRNVRMQNTDFVMYFYFYPGLMNGLYVLVGCILTVLLIVIVSCCM